MATTPKGIYYPNDYNEIADIPEDMKKMAESIDGVFEDTDSDLSDIQEEQTTQNNRLNSLEVDNTTNKSDILTNKQEINNIKTEQTTQNTNIQTNADNISALTSRVTETEEDISDIQEEQAEQNTNISTNATNIESLQEENENLKSIVNQLPQVTGQGTEVTLENTIEAPFTIFDVKGNCVQDGTPSPDNEVPNESAGDNGSINEKINNKNVWNIDKFKNLYGTNTYETYNNVECLKLAGATQRYDFEGKENTQYTFQFKLIGSTINNEIGAFSLVYSDGTSDYHDGILTPKTYTFTSKANKTLVSIVWLAWSAGHFIYIDKNSMQLELGSTSTPYVEHKEQDYSIPVQQPMRSIGDVRDGFVKQDGVWYERHYIGEKILNGTENWEIYNTHIYLYDDTFKASVGSNDYVPNYKCNYFIPDSLVNANSNPNGKILQNVWGVLAKHKGIAFNSQDAFSDIATLKTWLSAHNTSVLYELETPLDLPCTQAQIDVLENKPSTYKDFTIIQSEDVTEAYLEVAGIYDLNKLITRVETLETEV